MRLKTMYLARGYPKSADRPKRSGAPHQSRDTRRSNSLTDDLDVRHVERGLTVYLARGYPKSTDRPKQSGAPHQSWDTRQLNSLMDDLEVRRVERRVGAYHLHYTPPNA